MALKRKRNESGQVLALVAVVLAGMAIFIALVLSYGTLTLRVMHTMAAADAAAHAGAMEVHVLPNGRIETSRRAEDVTASMFIEQAPSYARLRSVTCGLVDEKPYCDLTVHIVSDTFLPVSTNVNVRAVLAYGTTRGEQ